MTNREFLTNVANGIINDETISFAENSLAKLDATNAARKNKPSKKAIENAPIMEAIENALTNEYVTATVIAEAQGISVQLASALCRKLVAEGRASVTEVKVPKKGVQKGYSKPITDAE